MNPVITFLCCCFIAGCIDSSSKKDQSIPVTTHAPDLPAKPYSQLKTEIELQRKEFSKNYTQAVDKNKIISETKNYWVTVFNNDLRLQWEHTPWDFNGTTREPRKGSIACGYFVTTLLQDMGYKLNREKLSTCTSMSMMKSLTPEQSIQNLSYLSYDDFNKKIRDAGNGIFIIGLDFHTGFLINDGNETWFFHSNYIGTKGVVREKISESAALKASKTRFVISLTDDDVFLFRWMHS